MALVSDILTLALKDSGVVGAGQVASPEDANDALTRLSWMVQNWTRRRWLVYHLLTTVVVSTGAQTYSLGPGQQFDIPRIDRLEAAFLRQPTNGGLPIDWPLEILQSMEDYSRITLKTLTSFSGGIFYDSGWPNGTIYPWPIPLASTYSLGIVTKADLPVYTSLPQDLNLPPEYFEPLYTNMVVRLRAAYRLPPDPVFTGLAKSSMETIRTANAQIPRLYMPPAVASRSGGYNILADQPN